MFLQQDTIPQLTQPVVEAKGSAEVTEETSAVAATPAAKRTLTPYQVLQALPKDATPAQQDSAIQAVFHPNNTHLSTRPDTLHLPGHDKGKSYKDDLELPQYYRDAFYSSKDSLWNAGSNMRFGIAGDPIPYSMRNDDVITGLLLGCFILAIIAFSRSRLFIIRQAKNFFYIPRSENVTTITETTSEFRFQFFLIFQTCLLCALISFFYIQANVADTFLLDSQYHLILIFFCIYVGYFLIKSVLYTLVDLIFFNKKKNEQWIKAYLFIMAMTGIVLFPLVLLQSYFDMPMQNALIYASIVLILVKILTFYKCYVIFFRRNALFLQIILYFCALEIVPLLTLGGILTMTVNHLKINF